MLAAEALKNAAPDGTDTDDRADCSDGIRATHALEA